MIDNSIYKLKMIDVIIIIKYEII